MATKVYLSGNFVFVEQTGTTTLKIPTRLAKYSVLQPVASNDGLTVPVAENILFSNTSTNENRTEAITSVENASGASYADFAALQKYLIFIPNKTTQNIFKEGASTANQLTMIDQNTDIIDDLEENEANTRELRKIKEELKINNKILGKIYN